MSLIATGVLAVAGFWGLNFFTSYVVNTLILPFSIAVAGIVAYNLYSFNPLDEENIFGIIMYSSLGIASGVVANTLLNKFAGTISNYATIILGLGFVLFVYNPEFLGKLVRRIYNYIGGD